MRKYLNINLNDHSVSSEQLEGEEIIKAGRNFIVRSLLDAGAATVDPLSPENPLIFSAGPFAGTNFSNANRISVGCKSPLTGGIKESNGGGTFAFALGQLEIAGLTLNGASDDWTIIRITKVGDITFEDASPYLGKGNFEAAAMLHEKYGDKVSLALCGPVGEYLGLIAGIAFSDNENRPVRLSARGAVGAVMGLKKVKAIVCDKAKMPTFSDRRKVMSVVKEYGAMIAADPAAQAMGRNGTAQVSDLTNHLGGLPVNNFSSGQQVDTANEVHKMGGDYIRDLNIERGGETTHACMPGCMIKCSNIYVDAAGNEIVSPLEYETICLLGTNVGIREPDDVARLNETLNDLGVDTIEVGATLGVLMEAGEAEFGDLAYMEAALVDIAEGTERGKLLAQGTYRVGKHFGVTRIPVVKKQAISAYDPRVIEVTGITMTVSAQGADHTTGNLPAAECAGKSTEELSALSLDVQINSAAADSLGICVFGRTVTNANHEMIIGALNDAFGPDLDLDPDFINRLGRETLLKEIEFNELAGFTEADDVLPQFFHDEELPPTGKKARHYAADINKFQRQALQEAQGSS